MQLINNQPVKWWLKILVPFLFCQSVDWNVNFIIVKFNFSLSYQMKLASCLVQAITSSRQGEHFMTTARAGATGQCDWCSWQMSDISVFSWQWSPPPPGKVPGYPGTWTRCGQFQRFRRYQTGTIVQHLQEQVKEQEDRGKELLLALKFWIKVF